MGKNKKFSNTIGSILLIFGLISAFTLPTTFIIALYTCILVIMLVNKVIYEVKNFIHKRTFCDPNTIDITNDTIVQ